MRRALLLLSLLSLLLALLPTTPAHADPDDPAPSLLDDALESSASAELSALLDGLSPSTQHALRGAYVAIDRSRSDVLALPACDDDGDYVIVLSRGFLELVENVAYADASDRLRGTHLRDAYASLLARSQRIDTAVLPVPVPLATTAPPVDALKDLTSAFVSDALAWVVADEIAPAVLGSFTCPSPTTTHERGDDVWTVDERSAALRVAPYRLRNLADADAWAASHLVAAGASSLPAVELLRAMAPLEDARASGAAFAYLTLHPRSLARAGVLSRDREPLPAVPGMR